MSNTWDRLEGTLLNISAHLVDRAAITKGAQRGRELERKIAYFEATTHTLSVEKGIDAARIGELERVIEAKATAVHSKRYVEDLCTQYEARIAELEERVRDRTDCIYTERKLADDYKAENQRLREQLPKNMEHCTIQFKECEQGHGWLTAANWLQHDCQTCENQRLRKWAGADIGELNQRIAKLKSEMDKQSTYYPGYSEGYDDGYSDGGGEEL